MSAFSKLENKSYDTRKALHRKQDAARAGVSLRAKSVPYELWIFLFFCVELLMYVPKISSLNTWVEVYYAVSYDMGADVLMLVGSIVRLFTKFVTSRMLYILFWISTVAVCAMLSVFLGRAIRRSDRETKPFISAATAVFLAAPTAVPFLFTFNNFGRFDLYTLLISLLIVFCSLSKKGSWLIPALCVTGVLVQENFVLTFFPIAVIALLYNFYSTGFSRSALILGVVTAVSSGGVFLALRYALPGLGTRDPGEVIAEITSRADFVIPDSAIIGKYYAAATDRFDYRLEVASVLFKRYGLMMGMIYLPAIAALFSVWILALRCTKSKFLKFIFILCILSPLCTAPLFLHVDWDRWIAAAFLMQFITLFFFIYKKDADFTCSIMKISSFCKRHPALFLCGLIYLASFIFSGSIYYLFSILSGTQWQTGILVM